MVSLKLLRVLNRISWAINLFGFGTRPRASDIIFPHKSHLECCIVAYTTTAACKMEPSRAKPSFVVLDASLCELWNRME